jgi:septum formation protein
MMFNRLILASSSPRRRDLLNQIGIEVVVFPADIDETAEPGETPENYVDRMACSKARAAARKLLTTDSGQTFLRTHAITAPCCILASDTCGVIDHGGGRHDLLVKPENFAHFQAMMRDMSDRVHQVLTSVYVLRLNALTSSDTINMIGTTVSTDVRFRKLSEADIERYWQTSEPQDKAGGYGIQGKGALFVAGINGSYSNVVGLPLLETQVLLTQQGFPTWLGV